MSIGPLHRQPQQFRALTPIQAGQLSADATSSAFTDV